MITEARVAPQHRQVNRSMILREGEYFNREVGFGFNDQSIFQRLGDQEQKAEENIIWLPSETARICDVIDSGKGVMLEGGLGAGKSAVVYGVRSTYRANGRPYALIDGHYMNAPFEKINSVFMWAERNDALLLWDSFDYLPSKSRKIRKGPLEHHMNRTRAIMQRTAQYLDDGGKFLATSHTQPWLDKYGHPDLLANEWADVKKRLYIHQIVGRFEKDEEVVQFFKKAAFSDAAIQCLTSIDGDDIRSSATALDIPPSQIEELVRSLSSYRIAKLLALDPSGEETRIVLDQGCTDPDRRDQVVTQLTKFIIRSNEETRKRMGVDTLDSH